MTTRTLAPFPPPPDIEAQESSYAPCRFEPSGFGRELIMLGQIRIGEILPCGGRLKRVQVLFRLPDAPRTMFGASTMMEARRRAAEQTRAWLEAAGMRA